MKKTKSLEVAPMQEKVSFIDKNKNRINLEVEITYRNKYPEFTMSGNMGQSSGQIYSSINPANKSQKQLLDLWKEHHLKRVDNKIREEIINLTNKIKAIEKERRGNDLSDMDDSDLVGYIEEKTNFSGRNAELAAALVRMLGISSNDIDYITINDTSVDIAGIKYIAGDEEEMNQAHEEEIQQYIDDCVLHELPEQYRKYFDNEAFIEDCKADGRGHSLARYDGEELSWIINDTEYFAYRQ